VKPIEYLEEFERLIVETPIIKSFQIKERISRRFEAYIKVRLTLLDDSVLEITEFVQASEEDDAQLKRYSYHWMDASSRLKVRWDNVRHYPNLPDFPHHLHDGDEKNVLPGESMSLQKVLDAISHRLKG